MCVKRDRILHFIPSEKGTAEQKQEKLPKINNSNKKFAIFFMRNIILSYEYLPKEKKKKYLDNKIVFAVNIRNNWLLIVVMWKS